MGFLDRKKKKQEAKVPDTPVIETGEARVTPKPAAEEPEDISFNPTEVANARPWEIDTAKLNLLQNILLELKKLNERE